MFLRDFTLATSKMSCYISPALPRQPKGGKRFKENIPG